MIREIKFRGKHIDSGEWLIGDLVQDHFGDGSINTCHIYPKDAWNGPDCYEVDPSTVGQYTGLKDKDGKEVYEGDIIIQQGYSGKTKMLVQFAKGAFTTGKHRSSCVDTRPMLIQARCEVIGNIHDNPELLKGGEQ